MERVSQNWRTKRCQSRPLGGGHAFSPWARRARWKAEVMARAARSLAVMTNPPSRRRASISADEFAPISGLYAAGPDEPMTGNCGKRASVMQGHILVRLYGVDDE